MKNINFFSALVFICMGITLARAQAPANDNFTDAQAIICGSQVTATTISATLDQGDALSSGQGPLDGPNVWFSYNSADQGIHTVSITIDFSYSTNSVGTISIFTGTPGNLTLIAQEVEGFSSLLPPFIANGTDTYFIAVGGTDPLGKGDFEISLNCSLTQQQNCDTALPIAVDGITQTLDNIGVLPQPRPNCESFLGDVASLWHTFVAPPSGKVNIRSQLGTAPRIRMAIYSGSCNAFQQISNCETTSLNETNLIPGDTYFLQIWNRWSLEEGTFDITLTDPPPSNDDICNATQLSMGTTSAGDAYTNVGATAQTNEPENCATETVASVWFSFVAPASGGVLVSTDVPGGTHPDTQMALYNAPNGFDCANLPFASLAQVACNDDSANLLSVFLTTGLDPGATYYLQVDGYEGTIGTFGINIQDSAILEVPDCASNLSSSVDGISDAPGGTVTISWNPPTNAISGVTIYNIYTYADTQGTDPQFITETVSTAISLIASNETVYWNAVPVTGTAEAIGCDNISSFSVAEAPLGDIVQTAIPVTQADLPYASPLDNTGNYGDDYNGTDVPDPDGNTQVAIDEQNHDVSSFMFGKDVVYAFTPSGDGRYGFGLSDLNIGNNYAGLFLFEGVRFNTLVGYHVAFSGATRSLPGINLTAGTTYYVVVSGLFSSVTTPYRLSIEANGALGTGGTPTKNVFAHYPNPVSNALSLKAQKNIQNVSVYNLLGLQVLQTRPNTVKSELDMAPLQAGTYFVKVSVEGGATQTVKVVKQ